MTIDDGDTPSLAARRRIQRSRAKLVSKLRVQVGRVERALRQLTYERRAVRQIIEDTGGQPPSTPTQSVESADPEDVEMVTTFIDRLHAVAARAADPSDASTDTLERDLIFATLAGDEFEDAADHA